MKVEIFKEVKLVTHENGSRMEPRLKESWSEARKLRWVAGAASARTGLEFRVWANPRFSMPGEYQIRIYGYPGEWLWPPLMRYEKAVTYIQSFASGVMFERDRNMA